MLSRALPDDFVVGPRNFVIVGQLTSSDLQSAVRDLNR
jgi:hypothetical protein